MESTQGKLLVASPQLLDPNFRRTVVLMVQHNDDGALGLILNRPLQVTLREVCEKSIGESFDVKGVLHQGGPCEGPLMVLHGEKMQSDADVIPRVYFTTDRTNIETLLRDHAGETRYFVGYAGWSAGQLEKELESESWFTTAAQASHVFQSGPTLWSKLMTQRMLGSTIDPSRIPDDPSVN